MQSYKCTIHVDQNPDTVWTYMTDFRKAPRWRNLVREVEVLTPAPLRAGSGMKITFDVLGKVREAISEVWAFEPARRFGVRNTEQNATGVFEYTLLPAAAGTTVTFTWLLLPWLLKSNRLRYAEQLPRLKQEVERGRPDHSARSATTGSTRDARCAGT